MPLFRMTTNVPMADIPRSLFDELTDLMTEVTSTPKRHIFVEIQADQAMQLAGTFDPVAICNFHEIYERDHEVNVEIIKKLSAKIHDVLHIDYARIAILIQPVPQEKLGRFGTTLAQYFADGGQV